MRQILFAAALSISSVALAQTQPPPGPPMPAEEAPATEDTQPSGETVDDQSQSTGPQGITQQGTDPEGQATPPAGMNQMPMQTTAPAPQGTMPPMNRANDSMMTPRPAAGEYPPCSRSVTDGCIQTYERGVRRNRPR